MYTNYFVCFEVLILLFFAVRNPCTPNPCRNKGQCVQVGSSFRCRCRPGFIGRLCQVQGKWNLINGCHLGLVAANFMWSACGPKYLTKGTK